MIRINTLIIIIVSNCLSVFCQLESVQVGTYPSKFIAVSPSSMILEDPLHKFSIGDILNSMEGFVEVESENPNLDFTASSWWIRFKVENNSRHERNYVLETGRPLTNLADLYVVENGTIIQTLQSGDDRPFDVRAFPHRKVVFPLMFEPDKTYEILIKLRSDGEVLSATTKLWEPEAFNERDYFEQFILGGFYGLLVFVVIIYFFFYAALREKSFLYYVIYVCTLALLQFSLDGFTVQYLFPNSPWLANHIVVISASITVFFIMRYAQSYLELETILPKFNKVYKVLMGITLVIVAYCFLGGKLYQYSFPIVNAVSLISTLLILVTIITAQVRHCKVSFLFSSAFFFLILGAVIFILSNFNVIKPTLFTDHAMKLGSALEVIFLSLTMANKFRDIQREKELAQAETLEKLEEMNQLKDEINIKLEVQVKERTAEIHKQKEELQEKNKDITDSITYAKRIQTAILPPDKTIEKHLPESFVLFRPKDIVSGDFYWHERVGDRDYICAADCTGHGVPGAMVSVVGNNSLNRCIKEFGLIKPGEILDKLTSLVIETFEKSESEVKDGMDMSLCCIDQTKGTIEYAGANNPLYLIELISEDREIRENEIISDDGTHVFYEIKANKQPIGSYAGHVPFDTHTIQIKPGLRIYMFSDGLPDQFGGPKGKKFKYKTFKHLLMQDFQKPIKDQKSLLNDSFEEWKTGFEQTDDVCVIGVGF